MVIRELITLLGFSVNEKGAREYERELDRVANKATQLAAGIGAVLAGAFGITKIIEAGDAYTSTMNRLGAATAGPEQAAEAFSALYSSARETGVAVDETSKAFMRFSPAMQRAGYGMDDTIGLIDGIQKGLLSAGATAAETSSVFLQLGQAINSGTFAGDELRSFLEGAPPSLVNRFAEAVGTTSDKLKEMGSNGQLTAKNVLPALIEAAKAGRDEFGKMRVTVGLATARTRVAMDYFIAQLDRAFHFTERLAEIIEEAGRKFDDWRRYIPTIRDATNELGGLERILGAVAWGVGAATVAIGLLNGALSTLLLRFALIPGLVFLAGAMLQDFYAWVTGADVETQFGKWFGPFDQLVAPLKDAMKDVKTLFTGAPDEIQKAWDRLKAYFVSWAPEALKNFPPFIQRWLGVEPSEPPQDLDAYRARAQQMDRERGAALAQSRRGAPEKEGPGLLERIDAALGGAQQPAPPPQDHTSRTAGDWLTDMLGAIGVRQQVQQPDGTLKLLQPGESMTAAVNDALMRRGAAGTTNNVTTTQNATVTNNVTVNATGTSGAEVASATQRGMGDVLLERFWEDRMARNLRSASPAYEGAGGMAP